MSFLDSAGVPLDDMKSLPSIGMLELSYQGTANPEPILATIPSGNSKFGSDSDGDDFTALFAQSAEGIYAVIDVSAALDPEGEPLYSTSGEDGETITVTARRIQIDQVYFGFEFVTYSADGVTSITTEADPQPTPAGHDTGSLGVDVKVSMNISDPANQAEAIQAAKNVARALVAIEAKLQSVNPSILITWFDGTTTTAGAALDKLLRTNFIIDDRNDYGNGGVGQAVIGKNGQPDRVFLNFESFDGDLDANGRGDYASPTYTDMQGMKGILLHELGHLYQEADVFQNRNHQAYYQRYRTYIGYNNSEYWQNVERFANDFAAALASSVNMHIQEYLSTALLGAVDPQSLDPNYHFDAPIEELSLEF